MTRTERKKILYIQKPAGGGSLIALYEMVRILDKKRFEAVIFCYQKNEYTQILSELDAEVIYHSEAQKVTSPQTTRRKVKGPANILQKFKRFFLDDFKMAKSLSNVILQHRIDLIHHNCDFPFVRQGILANKYKLPQVCHYRSLQPYKRWSFDWLVDKQLAKKINYNVFISTAVKQHFRHFLKISEAKSIVVRDIVDTDKFQHTGPDRKLLKAFGFSERDKVISCIGRLVQWKGQHVFIKAFAQVLRQIPEAKALIVGSYEQGVGSFEYYKQLQKLAADLGLSNKLLFTGNRHDIPAILSISDCVVHSSVAPEPQGLVIVEALFYRKPIVVTDSGGAAELIVDEDGGIKVCPGNAEEMAGAISHLITNKNRFIRDKPPKILDEFQPERQIRMIEQLYSDLLAQHN